MDCLIGMKRSVFPNELLVMKSDELMRDATRCQMNVWMSAMKTEVAPSERDRYLSYQRELQRKLRQHNRMWRLAHGNNPWRPN